MTRNKIAFGGCVVLAVIGARLVDQRPDVAPISPAQQARTDADKAAGLAELCIGNALEQFKDESTCAEIIRNAKILRADADRVSATEANQ